ncbi:unnamed protein product [Choristocarpus tenellus]
MAPGGLRFRVGQRVRFITQSVDKVNHLYGQIGQVVEVPESKQACWYKILINGATYSVRYSSVERVRADDDGDGGGSGWKYHVSKGTDMEHGSTGCRGCGSTVEHSAKRLPSGSWMCLQCSSLVGAQVSESAISQLAVLGTDELINGAPKSGKRKRKQDWGGDDTRSITTVASSGIGKSAVKAGMLNRISTESSLGCRAPGCERRPRFGHEGRLASHCILHRKSEMIDRPRNRPRGPLSTSSSAPPHQNSRLSVTPRQSMRIKAPRHPLSDGLSPCKASVASSADHPAPITGRKRLQYSRFLGVFPCPRPLEAEGIDRIRDGKRNWWMARIWTPKRGWVLVPGCPFEEEEEAALAYDVCAQQEFGQGFATLNFGQDRSKKFAPDVRGLEGHGNGKGLVGGGMRGYNGDEAGLGVVLEGRALPEPGGDGNLDVCMICKHGGSLICCESCPSSYHEMCLPPGPWKYILPFQRPDEEWNCHECLSGNEAADEPRIAGAEVVLTKQSRGKVPGSVNQVVNECIQVEEDAEREQGNGMMEESKERDRSMGKAGEHDSWGEEGENAGLEMLVAGAEVEGHGEAGTGGRESMDPTTAYIKATGGVSVGLAALEGLKKLSESSNVMKVSAVVPPRPASNEQRAEIQGGSIDPGNRGNRDVEVTECTYTIESGQEGSISFPAVGEASSVAEEESIERGSAGFSEGEIPANVGATASEGDQEEEGGEGTSRALEAALDLALLGQGDSRRQGVLGRSVGLEADSGSDIGPGLGLEIGSG